MVVDVLKKGRSKLFDPGLVDICLAELESDAPFRLVLANA